MKESLINYLYIIKWNLRIIRYISPITGLKLIWIWILSIRSNLKRSYILYNSNKHPIIIDFLFKRYGHLIPKELSANDDKERKLPIWTFWMQGEDFMPPIVKICYQSIIRNSNGRPVFLLCEKNLSDYIDIPCAIINLYKTRKISVANFSDVVRLMLLAKYGGHWLDCTVYVNRPLTEDSYNPYFNSIKMPIEVPNTISDYRWASFCLYSCPCSSPMIFFSEVMLAYFHDYDYIIDYFLIDYLFELLYKNNNEFKKIIDDMPRENQYTYSMIKNINNEYSYEMTQLWKQQQFFKLSWKLPLKEGNTLFHYLQSKK